MGQSESRKEDGTYIATFFLTYLFLIPIWPIRGYVKSRRDNAYVSIVPLGMMAFLYSMVVRTAFFVGLPLMIVTTTALVIANTETHNNVYILNASTEPIYVTVGGVEGWIKPGTARVTSLASGIYAANATREDGSVADKLELNVGGDSDATIVWNIAGVGAVVEGKRFYGVHPEHIERPTTKLHCDRVIRAENVDLVFQPLPQTTDGATVIRFLALDHDPAACEKTRHASRDAHMKIRVDQWSRDDAN